MSVALQRLLRPRRLLSSLREHSPRHLHRTAFGAVQVSNPQAWEETASEEVRCLAVTEASQ